MAGIALFLMLLKLVVIGIGVLAGLVLTALLLSLPVIERIRHYVPGPWHNKTPALSDKGGVVRACVSCGCAVGAPPCLSCACRGVIAADAKGVLASQALRPRRWLVTRAPRVSWTTR
jgi:hypothetical protein